MAVAFPTTIPEGPTEEGWHTLQDGEKLYFKIWKTPATPKARMIAVHGFSDHCNAYGDLFPSLAARGIEVFGFDQRGWGRSVKKPSRRGDTGPTTQVLADMTSVLRRYISVPTSAVSPPPTTTTTTTPPSNDANIPLFLFGHSMGGAQVLHWASHHPTCTQIQGYILESPFVSLSPASKPSQLLVFSGRMAAKLLPKFQMVNRLDVNLVSRDPATNEACRQDALCHDTGTLEGLAGMLSRADELDQGKVRVKGGRALWLGHGSGDGICDHDAAKRWFERDCGVEDKTFKSYEGGFHRLHAEPNGEGKRFCDDVAEWILQRAD